MKAARIHRFGPPDVIALEETELPTPGAGEVRVRVKAAGVGPWDGWVRAGRSAIDQPLPLTLGSDLAGVVDAVGEGALPFARGDEVYGVTNPRFTGACAEYALAAAGMIARKPRRLDFVEAASAPVVAVTAWRMLIDYARVVAGQTVIVHGAAGNVGAFAVRLAHLRGARVIASASSPDGAWLRALGADEVFDLRGDDPGRLEGAADAVLDTIGGEVLKQSYAMCRPGGVLVSSVAEPDADLARRAGIRAVFFLVAVTTRALERIAALFEAGELTARVGAVLPLSEIRRAHQMLEGTLARPAGKIVLRVID
jgi:NADPH:quinone reductase-like Zn-dependent oxidoreductase